jgi:hypothetical protein
MIMEAIKIKTNEAKKLMQINIIPRMIGRDGVEGADELVERLEAAIDSARQAKKSQLVNRIVVLVDGRCVMDGALGDVNICKRVLDTLTKYRSEETLLDSILIANPDETVRIMYRLMKTIPDLGTFRDRIKLIQ